MTQASARSRGAASARALLAALALLLPGGAAAQQDRSMVLEDFRSFIRVEENGDIEVREDLHFRFYGSWEGIYRDIPVEYRSPSGLPYHLHLDVESVTAPDGSRLRHEVRRRGDYRRIKVWVPGARDAARTVSIRYTSPNALRFHREGEDGFEEHYDELYWNVTGTEWEMPILRASVLVSLPEGTTGRRAKAFSGSFGSTAEEAQITEVDEGFLIERTRPLSPGEGLTAAVAWDPGVVAPPTALEHAWLFLSAYWPLGLPFLAFAVMLWLWWTRGRDPASRPIMPSYEPPDGMSPGELGTLIDTSPDLRDVTATLVDLAVRGHVRIEEMEGEKILGLFEGKPDYRFVRRTERASWEELAQHERTLLRGLFGSVASSGAGGEESVLLSDLENEFYKTLEHIQDDLYRLLLERGHYDHRPDRVKLGYLVTGILVCVLGMPFGAVLSAITGIPGEVAAAGLMLSGVPVLFFSFFMPAPTRSGARRREEIRGFQEFLDRVEEDRFRRMITSPEQFERFLPHAMALGVERKWAKAFEGLYREPPEWYVAHGGGTFRTLHLTSALNSFSTQAGTTLASRPRSSGGSGFSGGGGGGGFSGGGFGGGGGGGF